METKDWALVIILSTFCMFNVLGSVGRHYYMDVKGEEDRAVFIFRIQGLLAMAGAWALFFLLVLQQK